MLRRNLVGVMLVFGVALLLISACSGNPLAASGPSPTSPLAATDTPQPTLLPTETSTPAPTSNLPPAAPTEVFQPGGVSAPDCSYGGLIRSIEAPEQFTVIFTLCAPDPAFLTKIARPNFAIQPKEWLEVTGGGGQLLEKPIGTGPYQLADWKRGSELIFSAFPAYWGPTRARTPQLIFRWDHDPSQRLLELQAGIVDAMDNPAAYEYEFVESDPNLTLVFRPPANTLYLGFDSSQPPFNEERVRRAVALALDRQKIIEKYFPPGTQLALFFTPCEVPNGCVGQEWYSFDPVQAKALLTEVGYTFPFSTRLTYQDVVHAYLPQPGLVAEEIKAQLNKYLGINVTLEVLDPESFEQALNTGQLPGMHLAGWYMDYPDVTNFLDFHLGSRRSGQFGTTFEDILNALQGGASVFGDEQRRPYYEQANNLIREQVPLIPLAHVSSAAAFKKQIEGIAVSSLGLESFAGMAIAGQDSLIWIQNDEPRSLYCADELDSDSLRACAQILEGLYRYRSDGFGVEPALAESCQPNADLTVWTCRLRQNVQFHDGSWLDAGDVVMSFVVQWDAAHPLHQGRDGNFRYWKLIWGDFLNAP